MPIIVTNPAYGDQFAVYEEHSPAEVDKALERVQTAYLSWRRSLFSERAVKLRRAAELLRNGRDMHAKLMAQEMGKPVVQGRAEAEKCAWICEYYAEHGERFLSPEPAESDSGKSFVAFEPLGAVLAIMPWNFPLWQVFRAAAPALVAGNVMVLKHAANVPGTGNAIEQVLAAAGFPPGVFVNLRVGSERVADLIRNPVIQAVTLTGSTGAGRAVAAAAGQALKKTVLELGGSDAYVVLEDADIAAAATACVASRLINGGQSCIAAKRFIVVEPVRKEFERRFVEGMKAQKMGDPLKEDTTLGPLARHDLRDALHQQVEESVAKGARLLLGGKVPEGPGAFYPPTVLTDVKPGMPAYDDELFGPVASIVSARDEQDAVRIANDSVFGLGGAVFTRDRAKGERLAHKEIETGTCFVNAYVKSDPRLPFGGIKQSGYGREMAAFGIREFVNIKSIHVA